jgi:hypothetical protein
LHLLFFCTLIIARKDLFVKHFFLFFLVGIYPTSFQRM